MSREIRDVRRCGRCAAVVQAMVADTYDSDEGGPTRAVYWLPRRAHSGETCDQMLALAREEWPYLFDMET